MSLKLQQDIDEVASEYKFIFNRLRKIEKSLRGIVIQNSQLKEANHRLRLEHDTWQNREAARERVLKELQEVGDKTEDARIDNSDNTVSGLTVPKET